jgi:hypothetical protein
LARGATAEQVWSLDLATGDAVGQLGHVPKVGNIRIVVLQYSRGEWLNL